MPMPTTMEVRPTSALNSGEWDEIWQLTDTFYETTRDYAESTLRQHQSIALLRAHDSKALIGMAALNVVPLQSQGRKQIVIFTSHVLLAEQYRGQNLLQRLGLHTFLRTRLRNPFVPMYWCFDTFSYKSYWLLPRNFTQYWPRNDRSTPAKEKTFMDEFAAQNYGDAWQAERGIVTRSAHKRLRPDTAPLDERLLHDPHLQFFARVNPEHAQGDMLFCLCPLNLINWGTLVGVWLRRSLRRRKSASAQIRQ